MRIKVEILHRPLGNMDIAPLVYFVVKHTAGNDADLANKVRVLNQSDRRETQSGKSRV